MEGTVASIGKLTAGTLREIRNQSLAGHSNVPMSKTFKDLFEPVILESITDDGIRKAAPDSKFIELVLEKVLFPRF